jgi:hypothetical protein
MNLQDESVEALQQHVIEAVDQILLNEQLFHLGRFRFPVRLFQGQNRFRTNQPNVTAASFMTRPPGFWPLCFAISSSGRSLA